MNIDTIDPGHTAHTVNASAGIKKYCCNDNSGLDYCAVDGGMYTWNMAMYLNSNCSIKYYSGWSGSGINARRQGICPRGWHIPSEYEIVMLEDAADSSNIPPVTPANCLSTSFGYYADVYGCTSHITTGAYNTGGGYYGVDGSAKLTGNWNGSAWVYSGSLNYNAPGGGSYYLAGNSFNSRNSTHYMWTSTQPYPDYGRQHCLYYSGTPKFILDANYKN